MAEGRWQVAGYPKSPEYTRVSSDDDRLHILVCQVKVWQATGPDYWTVPQDCLCANEVVSIEVHKSYKELLSTAVVRFPMGAIVSTKSNFETEKGVEQDYKEMTASGEVMTQGVRTDKDGTPLLGISTTMRDNGVLEVKPDSKKYGLMDRQDLQIGSRIQILAGYVYSQEEYRQEIDTDCKNLELIFNGFIEKCSFSTPLEIHCEGFGSLFKKITCMQAGKDATYTVQDFFKDGGKFDFLKNTGIKLSKANIETDISLGKVPMTNQLVVADVLDEWRKCGLACYISDTRDGAELRIGYVRATEDSISDQTDVAYSDMRKTRIIQTDWHVANDGLRVAGVDLQFLAVRATGRTAEGGILNLTVRRKKDAESGKEDEFDCVNIQERPKKRAAKKAGNTAPEVKVKADMGTYTIVPFLSKDPAATQESLKKEAIQYYKDYISKYQPDCPTGVSGTLTLFGEVQVQPSDVIGVINPRNPQLNGYYLVESVDIKFGTEGYRKELKIPHKVINMDNVKVL